MLHEILIDIFYVVIMAGIAAVTSRIIPYIKLKLDGIKNENLKEYIELTIQYAENKLNTLKGKDKFSYVINQAMAWCSQNGIKFTQEQIENITEGLFNMMDLQNLVNTHKE